MKDSFPSLQTFVDCSIPHHHCLYHLPRICNKTTRQTRDICETEEKQDREMATTSSCNFNWGVNGKGTPEQPCSSSKSSQLLISSNLSFSYSNIRYCLSLRSHQILLSTRFNETKNSTFVVASAKANPLKIMISGAPASGKGTQCEFITEKYVLVHIAAGDLLRA